MLNHDELMTSWETDSTLDRSDLREQMYQHPMLHSKYLCHLLAYKVALRKVLTKYQSTRVMRQRYFNGELTKDELDANGLQQFLAKRPLKSEMETLIDASPDIQKIQDQAAYLETMILACESILKDINSRYFLFRSIVDYEKFQAGV